MARANVFGGSKDPNRGTWCTPKRWAEYVGPFDLDPFSNPRGHIVAAVHCMLERGDDGLGGASKLVGSYAVATTEGKPLGAGETPRPPIEGRLDVVSQRNATEATRVFLQPPYELVDEAIAHYGHTRFCALLRFDPPTAWLKRLVKLSELVCVVSDKRMDFEPPPAVGASSNPFPHALFYRRAEDATRDVLRRCLSWRPNP